MTDNFAQGLVARLQQCLEEQANPDATEDATAPLAPLHTRLQKLLDQIPISTQQQGLSILEIQACLRGRKGGLPHIGELGAAMRRLGWQRRRRWSDEDAAFSSKWYPMDQFPTRRGD